MAPVATTGNPSSSPSKGGLTWRPTKIMNMRDLSKDDDFLSHLLVEKLGTGAVPLLVHKMDSSRRLPKTDANDLLQIVRRLVMGKGPLSHVIRQAVDELLALPPIRYYLKPYTQKQINAFATHASRYFELYHPSGSIEIAHTSRYSHHTGKSELCILATRPLAPGTVITELKGSMANLSEEEDKELKRTDLRNSDIRRDFSVIHSKQMKKNHLFLGPARFVNHDCENNCELFREGKYITFRVLRPISMGEEITAHYGDGYFGRKNRHCLCETCEQNTRGGYAPDPPSEDEEQPAADSDLDSDSDGDSTTSESEDEDDLIEEKAPVNMNERRTRRGVYAILQEDEDDSDESDVDETSMPLQDAQDIPADGEIELEADASSELTSLSSERTSIPSELTSVSSRSTPNVLLDRTGVGHSSADPEKLLSSCSSSLTSLSSVEKPELPCSSFSSTSPKSIISNRRLKAQDIGDAQGSSPRHSTQPVLSQSFSPPLREEAGCGSETSESSPKRLTRSSARLVSMSKGDSPAKALTAPSVGRAKSREKTIGSTVGAGEVGRNVKTEDPEVRVLRARPPLPAVEAVKAALINPLIPRGRDGKILPTCATCSNILPVISVDSQVVWGFGNESSPRKGKKKKERQECPRCLRHFAIYGQAWPSRLPGPGASFAPTPREEGTPADCSSRRVTHKALPVLDRKLSAVSTSHKARRPESAENERPPKRQKTTAGAKVLMSAKAKQALSKLGRNHGERHSNIVTTAVDVPEAPKRKRGRPRLTSLKKDEIKVEKTEPKSLVVKHQPRDVNGRFGKKAISNGRYSRRKTFATASARASGTMSRAQRAIERGKVKTWLEKKTEATESREKEHGDSHRNTSIRHSHSHQLRSHEQDVGDLDQPRKRFRGVGDEVGDESGPTSSSTPSSRPFVSNNLPSFTFKSIGLFRTPNPLSFARRAWAVPHSVSSEDLAIDLAPSSDDETEGPVTPDDGSSPPIVVNHSDSETIDTSHPHPPSFARNTAVEFVPPLSRGALTFKPSPFNFARRRWSSLSSSPKEDNPSSPRSERLKSRFSMKTLPSTTHAGNNDIPESDGSTVNSTSPKTRLNAASANWPGDDSSSGEEDVIMPGSPDPSTFVLQRRASFASGSRSLTSGPVLDEVEPRRISLIADTLLPFTLQRGQGLAADHPPYFVTPRTDQDLAADEAPFLISSWERPTKETTFLISPWEKLTPDETPFRISPWTNQHSADSTFLRKSSPFQADDPASPPSFVHAGWDTDISNDA